MSWIFTSYCSIAGNLLRELENSELLHKPHKNKDSLKINKVRTYINYINKMGKTDIIN